MLALINNLLTEAVLRRAAGLGIIWGAAFIQSAHLFLVSGLNPNLAAAALLSLAYFEKSLAALWFFALSALILLLPYPFGLWDGGAFIVALAAALAVKAFLARPGAKSLPAVLVVFTLVFYVLLAPVFVLDYPVAVLGEALLNAVWGAAFFILFLLMFASGARSFVRSRP